MSETYKDGVITLADWHKGVADSPYLGFAEMNLVEVFEKPGAIKIAYQPTLRITTTGLCIARVVATTGDVFELIRVEGGQDYLYKNAVNLTNVNGDSWDMLEFMNYLFISTTSGIQCYGPLTGPAVYYADWKTGFTSQYYLKMIVDEDVSASVGNEAIYICNGNTIAKISSFVSGAPPTATLTLAALTLPGKQYAVTFATLGSNLMIGTQGGSNWSARGSQKVGNIYPWSKSLSDSFNKPIRLNEAGIHAMASDNNKLYILAGTRGNVYITNSVDYQKIRRIPFTQDRPFSNSICFYPNAIAFNANSNLLVGLSINSGSFNSLGIYEIELSNGYSTVLKHVSSGGNSQNVNIGFIQSSEIDQIAFGWQNGVIYGIDNISSNTRYSNYLANIVSPLILVGSKLIKKTFTQGEFVLASPLVSGQGLKLQYRKSLQGDWVDIGEFNFATLGSVLSHNFKALIGDAQVLQIKVLLTQNSANIGTDLELINIRLW